MFFLVIFLVIFWCFSAGGMSCQGKDRYEVLSMTIRANKSSKCKYQSRQRQRQMQRSYEERLLGGGVDFSERLSLLFLFGIECSECNKIGQVTDYSIIPRLDMYEYEYEYDYQNS